MKGWDWARFHGTAHALKYNRRDLPLLIEAVQQVPGRRAVVQAGGNLGIWPKYLAGVFQTVYTAEPDSANFLKLCFNAPEANIIRLQVAFGSTTRLVGISRRRRDPGTLIHEGLCHVAGDGPVPMLPIDALRLPLCDAIVLDCEGWDLDALMGAKETIARCRPVLVCEVNKNMAHVGLTEGDYLRFFDGISYRARAWSAKNDRLFVPAEWAA